MAVSSNIQERRQHPRAFTRTLLRYRNAEQFFTDYVQNISLGGIFITSPHPVPVGTRLHISFALPDYDHPIVTEWVVVRSTSGVPQTRSESSCMGIQFRRLDEETLNLLDAYVNTRLA